MYINVLLTSGDSTLAEIGLPIDPPPEVASEISQLLKQYTGKLKHCVHLHAHIYIPRISHSI